MLREGRLEALANFSLYARNLAKCLYSISTLYSMYASKGLISWFEQCENEAQRNLVQGHIASEWQLPHEFLSRPKAHPFHHRGV